MTTEGPRTEVDSITSGYSVPWARNARLAPTFFAAASNTSMNSRPMIFRFRSGSLTPLRRARKRRDGVHGDHLQLEPVREALAHLRAPSLRSRPLSTKTQVRRSPIASWTSSAATAESTPPESAQMHAAVRPTVRGSAPPPPPRTTPRSSRGGTRRRRGSWPAPCALLGVVHLGVEQDAEQAAVRAPPRRRPGVARRRADRRRTLAARARSSRRGSSTRWRAGSALEQARAVLRGWKLAWPYSLPPAPPHVAARAGGS